MPDLIIGKPKLRFVLKKNGNTVDDFSFQPHEYGTFSPVYSPDFLTHTIQTKEMRRKLRGFRYHGSIYWEVVEGSILLRLAKLMQKLTKTSKAYDVVYFYPSAEDMPNYKFAITIDDDDVELSYYYLLGHKEFTLKIMSAELLDAVPMAEPEFSTWGNISLTFLDVATITFESLPANH